ncbi:cyanobactin maturation protease PatG family protein, partial [Streptomyces puniciscabiei]
PAPGAVPADTAPAGAVPPARPRPGPEARLEPSGLPGEPEGGALQPPSPEPLGPASPHPAPGVHPACACQTGTSGRALVYAIGTIGFDYTTEARRDSFRQAMPFVEDGQDDQGRPRTKQPDVYDPTQLRDYLITAPWAANNLAWTLMVDGAPVYALEAEPAIGMEYGETFDEQRVRRAASEPSSMADLLVELARPPVSTVYRTFRDAIVGEALKPEDENFVSLVSVPGVLTDRTTRLFSGQVVPVVEVKSRGLYTWNEAALVEDVIATVTADNAKRNVSLREDVLRKTVRALLDKLYYQFRNLGQTDADRALNYAGTNAFLLTSSFADGLLGAKYVPGDEDRFYSLDSISVSKSTYCRESSICYDVVTTFFDPENELRSRLSFLQTIDVSIETPVSVAPVHQFLGAM